MYSLSPPPARKYKGVAKGVIAPLVRGSDAQITEMVVKAARNHRKGKEVMLHLLEQRGDDVQVTEEVVKAAAGNEWRGKEVMTLLLEQRGDDIQITEEMVA